MDAAVKEPTAEMSEAERRRKSIEPAVDVPSPGAKSTAQPATAPSPNGGVATQQPVFGAARLVSRLHIQCALDMYY